MKAVLKKVDQPAEIVDVDLTYQFKSDFVGGWLEFIPLAEGIDLVANEEAMFCGAEGGPLPQNACGILGNFLIIGSDTEGEPRDLTDTELVKAIDYIKRFEHEQHPSRTGGAIVGFFGGTQAEVDARLKEIWDERERRWEGR